MRPTQRCVLLFAVGVGVALAPALFGSRYWTFWPAWVGLCVLLSGLDAALALGRGVLSIEATTPPEMFIGDDDACEVVLSAPRSREATVEVLADLDPLFEPQPSQTVALAGEASLSVPLVARRRGIARVEALWLRWAGPFGLTQRVVRHDVGADIPVVPNVRAVRQAALRFFTARDYQSGLKVERYVGDGTEFESLREYVPGLDHRAMNWKASAKHRTLLCTEYRAERNHQVVIAVDTGHLMREPLDGVPKLDRAINASLHLAYTCLRTGDRVGWFAFDSKVRSYSEPDRGAHAFRHIQQMTSDIEYSSDETNFTLALAQLAQRLRRRSLVVLMTDFVDTVTAELMLENLARLSRRHLVLFVTLRDPVIESDSLAAPRDLGRLYRAVVAGDFVRERDLVLRRLARIGVQCLDAPPSQVTSGLLNRYLEMKRREMF